MWLHFALIFLAGTALVDSTVWKPNQTYHYIVRSRALTGAKVSDQVSGVVIKSQLDVHVESSDVLIVELTNGEYASIHTSLPDGWNVPIPDNKLKYVSIPTGDPLKVTLRNGKIDEVFASSKDAANPLIVNVLKGILSQLQFETGNLIQKQHKRPLGLDYDHQIYNAKEQTVSGYCKTEHDLRPISREDIRKTNLPPEVSNEDGYLLISKYNNYKDCMQESGYRFTVTDEVEKNLKENYITRLSLTNMIVSHKKEYFTILSSVMENVIQVRPKLEDLESSKVFNMMNLTLVKVEELTSKANVPKPLVSTGNLTYVYNVRERDMVEPPFFHDVENLMNIRENAESDVDSRTGRDRGMYSEHSKHSKYSLEESSLESNSREYGYFARNRENLRAPFSVPLRDYTTSDIIKEIDLLIRDIATEITTPDEIVYQGTLEKYTILTRVLRYLNETNLIAVRNKLEIEPRIANLDDRRVIANSVFRNALAQTGTFAALKLISTMVTTKIFTNLEAALVLGQLPRAARHPTANYIQQFYELIKSPEVKNQAVLNTTAPYAFSEIVRYALVMDQKYIYPYPEIDVKTQAREKLVSTYISYFANELEKAYKAKHDSYIVTCLLALGNIGDPAVIRVLKPYLEGKHHLTTFQRTIMISALRKVYPENVIGPILYKIYQNRREHYQERVMALKVLLKNNPPEHILINIAKSVFDEPNIQVKNAVITAIDSLTKLKGERYQELVRSALAANRIIMQHDQEYNIRYSTNIMLDYVNKKRDNDALVVLSTIGSKTKSIPNFVDVVYRYNSSSFSPPAFATQYGVSDINLLLRLVKRIIGQVTNEKQSTVDELAEKLNIVYNEVEPEGSYVISDEYRVFFVVFDRYTLQNLEENFRKLIQTNKNDYNKEYILTMLLNRQFIINYPSEIGLPVHYYSSVPALFSMKNKLRIKGKDAFEINQEMDIVVNRKTISRITFMTPFSNEKYFAGVDVDWQLRVPVAWSAKINLKRKEVGVEVKTIPGAEKEKLWQYSILPYSGKSRYPNFKYVHTDKNTQPIIIGDMRKLTTDLLFGKITVKQETDNFVANMYNQFNVPSLVDVFKNILNAFVSTPLHYQKQEISINPGRSNSIIVKINYSNIVLHDTEEKLSENLEKEQEELLSQSEIKIQDVLTADFLKVHLLIPGDNIEYSCLGITLQLLSSKNLSFRCYLVNSSKVTNVCGSALINQIPSSCLTRDLGSNKIRPFKASLRYGESCKNGKEISIKGLQKQNENVKEEIMNSKTYERSKEELAEGNFGLVNTEKICKVVDFMDELMLSIKMDPENIKALHVYALKWLLNKVIPNANIYSIKPELPNLKFSDFIDSNVQRQLQNNKMNVTVNCGSLGLQIPTDTSLLPFGKFINYELDPLWGIQNNKKYCILGNTKVKTFGNKVYPIEISKCSRVMLISPQIMGRNLNLDNVNKSPALSSRHNIAISFEDLGEKEQKYRKRQITIIYKNNKLHMRASDDAFYINGKPLKFIGNVASIEKNLNVRVVRLTPVLYEITVAQAEVVMWFNGENVKIRASDAYNGHVRGLCGTKDDQVETDFLIPQGCVVKKPEDFVAFYTLDSDNCVVDENTKEIKARALEKCTVIENRHTNVVADASSEEGISSQESTEITKACTLLRTDIRLDDKQACFSMRPIPVCAKGCKKWYVMKKPISYHCEKLSPEINDMIERIKAGANPDFSTKSPSMVNIIPIPKLCHPE